MKKTNLIFIVTLSISFYCRAGFAILPLVYDPYDVIQNTITAKNSVQSLINQAQQLQLELQNVKKLTKGHFENTNPILNQLTDLASQGSALSYGNNRVESIFNEKFPGNYITSNFNKDYKNWSDTTYDTLKNSMKTFALQGQLFAKENDLITELQRSSVESEGNLSAQQTAHRIALSQINQLQKLRQLLLTQASSQTTFMTYQLQKEQTQQAAVHDWLQKSQTSFHKYNSNHGFGMSDLPNL